MPLARNLALGNGEKQLEVASGGGKGRVCEDSTTSTIQPGQSSSAWTGPSRPPLPPSHLEPMACGDGWGSLGPSSWARPLPPPKAASPRCPGWLPTHGSKEETRVAPLGKLPSVAGAGGSVAGWGSGGWTCEAAAAASRASWPLCTSTGAQGEPGNLLLKEAEAALFRRQLCLAPMSRAAGIHFTPMQGAGRTLALPSGGRASPLEIPAASLQGAGRTRALLSCRRRPRPPRMPSPSPAGSRGDGLAAGRRAARRDPLRRAPCRGAGGRFAGPGVGRASGARLNSLHRLCRSRGGRFALARRPAQPESPGSRRRFLQGSRAALSRLGRSA
uniref:Uncharacterized protein n=1 Tax=Sphaerodactylus townsendi TaxID=933632 RepID=A0ACB8GDN7_9SAUR